MSQKNVNDGIHQQIEGFYKLVVLDGTTNEVVWEQKDWRKNLILNQGIDQIYSQPICDCFTYGIAGTGTRVNSVDSAGSSGSVSSTTLTLHPAGSLTDFTAPLAGYSQQVEAGDMIKFSNNTEVRVVSVGGATTATITPAATITELQFSVWKTSQSGLHVEKWRSATYASGSQYCSSSFSGSVVTHRRTYDFPTETGSLVTFTEIGVGWAAGGALTTFSRILLSGGSVSVDVGQKLRIIYQLGVTFAPTTPVSLSAIINGWPVSPSTNTSGSQMIQRLFGGGNDFVSTISSLGVTQGFAFLEPSSTNAGFFLSNVSQSLQDFGNSIDRSYQSYSTSNVTKAAYVTGSYLCEKSVTYGISDFGHTDIRSMGFGSGSAASASNQAFVLVFDQNQAKSTAQTLALTYRWTWARTLA